MFVRDSAACSLPNSETPMPAAAIARQDARMARMASIFTNGDDTLNGLISALGGNPIGAPFGNAGVPTDGTFNPFTTIPRVNWDHVPSVGPGGWFPTFPAATWNAGSGSGGGPGCVPKMVPLMTVVPIPAVVLPATPNSPATVLAPVPSTPAVPAAPCVDPAECAPTPDTICRNMRAGCYQQTQLSQRQLFACSEAGWQGIQMNPRRCPGGWNGGAAIPDMNLTPDTPTGQPFPGAPGMSGFTGEGSSVLWGSIALGVFALWAATQFDKKARRR